jgi:hypothetical protein
MIALINRNTTARCDDVGSDHTVASFNQKRAFSTARSGFKARQADKRAETNHASVSFAVNDRTSPSLIVID